VNNTISIEIFKALDKAGKVQRSSEQLHSRIPCSGRAEYTLFYGYVLSSPIHTVSRKYNLSHLVRGDSILLDYLKMAYAKSHGMVQVC